MRTKGFTFIELAFTGGILFLTLSLLLGAMVSIVNTSRIGEVRQGLSVYATSYLESLRGLPRDEGLSLAPGELCPCPERVSLDAVCILEDGTEVAVPVAEGTALPALVEVRVTASYTGERHLVAVPLSTLLYARDNAGAPAAPNEAQP